MNQWKMGLVGAMFLGLTACSTLDTGDVQEDTKLTGTESQTGTTNAQNGGVDSNVGAGGVVAPVDNSGQGGVDGNENQATYNTGADVNKNSDTDGNGIIDVQDPNFVASNDLDGDGILNIDDADIDGDGINNIDDADIDGDGILNIDDGDIDGDGIPNEADNDIDGDGIVNTADPDIDGDGILNGADPDVDGDGILNVDDADIDGDGINNTLDNDADGDGIINEADNDLDNDGLLNDDPNETDIDGDGIPNVLDPDIDGDGIPNESDTDINGDGVIDNQNPTQTIAVPGTTSDIMNEVFAAGVTEITFTKVIDLNEARLDVETQDFQLASIEVTDVKVSLVPGPTTDAFVAKYGTQPFTMVATYPDYGNQKVVESVPNALQVAALQSGISVENQQLFPVKTGWDLLNSSVKSPNKASMVVVITFYLTNPLAEEHNLQFQFDYSVVGNKNL